MDSLTATIDIHKASGRKIIRDLEQQKCTNIHYPEIENCRTHKEVFSDLLDRLGKHYDCDMHKLVKL
jgi:cystathionine beta-lyase/cystathionine gamma-synthase